MAYPFRTPQTADGDPPEWTPPDYAKPIDDSSEAWTPPDYAKPIETKAVEKPGIIGRIKSALTPAKTIHPTSVANLINTKQETPPDYGKRPDGSDKGAGFLGTFKLPNGSVASEYSIADSEQLKDEKGGYQDYPSLVPTLTKEEIKQVLDAAANGKEVPDSVKTKAEAHALERKKQGLPLFATPGEERTDLHPDLERVPGYDPNKHAETKGFVSAVGDATNQFLDNHPSIKKYGRRLLDVTADTDQTKPTGEGLMKVPGADKARGPETPERKDYNAVGFDQNKWSDEASKLPEKWHGIPIRYPAAFLGSLAGTALESLSAPENIAAMGAGIGSHGASEEPSIRQPETTNRRSVRTDLTKKPIKDTTPQQDRVAIALTKDSVPRTAANISDETGIPQPSVRRTMSELEKKSTTDQERLPISDRMLSKTFADEVSTKQADKLVKDEYEFAGDSIRQPEVQHRDFGYGQGEPPQTPPEQTPPATQEQIPQEPPIKQEVKPNFINPFEKASEEPRYTSEDIARSDANPYEMPGSTKMIEAPPIRQVEEPKTFESGPFAKYKEGQELPTAETPKAEFLALNEQGQPMYNIVEKDGTRSTFTGPNELAKRGIEVPETPKDAVPMKGSEIRVKFLEQQKASSAEAWKPPEYAKPIEESPNDITELHGGLGGLKPSSRVLEPNKGPYGAALDKLFQSMGDIKEARVSQDVMNKAERAKRFAKSASVKDEGVLGASKSLSAMKGEFGKVDLDKLKMTQPQVDSLFTAVKRAKITEGEKLRGYTALFKLFNGEGVPQRNELQILDDVFGNHFAEKITEMHGGLGAVGLKISKLANTMKSLQNSMSLAAPLRHGIGLAYRKEFAPAFKDMFKFFANKEYYNEGMKAITEGTNYLLKREAGLFTAKPGSLQGSEEEFLNSYAGDIPIARNVVGASQRGYVGFLNKLRDDVSETMLNKAEALGVKTRDIVDGHEVPTKETKAIMRFVNVFSGRGELPFGLEKITNELNTVLWSPRMMASRIQMFTNPKIYTDLPKGMRLEGLKSLLGIASLGTIIDTALAYGGAKISYNILSTDYGKSRYGTKLVDPWGGLQQYVVGAARFLAGKTDSSLPTSRGEITGRFLANKESPIASLVHTLAFAKKFEKPDPNDPLAAGSFTTQYGQKSSVPAEVLKRFAPILEQDIQSLIENDPKFSEDIGLDAIMGVASLAGMSQEYPEKKQKSSLLRPLRKLR